MQSSKTKSYNKKGQQEKDKYRARQYRHPGTPPANGQTLMQQKSINNPGRQRPDNFRVRRPERIPGHTRKNCSGNNAYCQNGKAPQQAKMINPVQIMKRWQKPDHLACFLVLEQAILDDEHSAGARGQNKKRFPDNGKSKMQCGEPTLQIFRQ